MRKVIALSALTVSALAAAAAPAAAAKYKVDVSGQGSYVIAADGSAASSGTATGTPFDGTYVATLAAADGTLPAPGECEAATGTLRVEGTRGRFVELSSTGTACGQYVQPPYVVTHVFTGRYVVEASSKRNLVRTDGFFEIRLATEGRSSMFAIDT